jgi:hypothetical protein
MLFLSLPAEGIAAAQNLPVIFLADSKAALKN